MVVPCSAEVESFHRDFSWSPASNVKFDVWHPIEVLGSSSAIQPSELHLRIEKVGGHLRFYKCENDQCFFISSLKPEVYEQFTRQIDGALEADIKQNRNFILALVPILASVNTAYLAHLENPYAIGAASVAAGSALGWGLYHWFKNLSQNEFAFIKSLFENIQSIPDDSVRLVSPNVATWKILDSYSCEAAISVFVILQKR